MLIDFDHSLATWLTRIGVPPFKAKSTTSPLINLALQHFSCSNAQTIIEAHSSTPEEVESLFKHCGVPNVILAQLNATRILESINLFGGHLVATHDQSEFIGRTELATSTMFVESIDTPVPPIDAISQIDQLEYQAILNEQDSLRMNDLALRRDPGFMLCHSIIEYLLCANEDNFYNVAVSLLPYSKCSLLKLINRFSKSQSSLLPINIEALREAAMDDEKVELSEILSEVLTLPWGLSPSRLSMLEKNYISRFTSSQKIVGANS